MEEPSNTTIHLTQNNPLPRCVLGKKARSFTYLHVWLFDIWGIKQSERKLLQPIKLIAWGPNRNCTRNQNLGLNGWWSKPLKTNKRIKVYHHHRYYWSCRMASAFPQRIVHSWGKSLQQEACRVPWQLDWSLPRAFSQAMSSPAPPFSQNLFTVSQNSLQSDVGSGRFRRRWEAILRDLLSSSQSELKRRRRQPPELMEIDRFEDLCKWRNVKYGEMQRLWYSKTKYRISLRWKSPEMEGSWSAKRCRQKSIGEEEQ